MSRNTAIISQLTAAEFTLLFFFLILVLGIEFLITRPYHNYAHQALDIGRNPQ
jgi:hypothetical protein